MTAHISTDIVDGNVSVYCLACYPGSEGVFASWENIYPNLANAAIARDAHNHAKHPVFVPAIPTNGVSAEDFTESHHGAGEGTTPEQAIDILRDRIKELRANADARDLEAAKEQIKGLKQALKQRMNESWENSLEIATANKRIEEQRSEIQRLTQLNLEFKETIQELLETPEPMPLCKNLEGHNYVPLDRMFVFCTRCGHSIHYKTKG